VAAMAAVDEATAEKALQLIEVEYEELPAVFDPEAAMAEGAPQIHPENPRFKNNINTKVHWDFGDVEKGFREAEHVIEERAGERARGSQDESGDKPDAGNAAAPG